MVRERRFLTRFLVFTRIITPFLLILLGLYIVAFEIKRHHPEQQGLFPSKEEILDYFRKLAKKSGHIKPQDKYIYFGVVFLITLGCLPVSPFEIAAGYIFGWEGMFIALPGKILGSLAAFLIGRIFWADVLRSLLAHRETFVGLQLAIQHNEWRFMFLIRFMYLPQWAKNYGTSILNVRVVVFAVTTVVVSLVYSVLFTYIGKTSDRLVVEVENGGVLAIGILAVGLGTAIFGLLYISSVVKQEISALHARYRLVDEQAAADLVRRASLTESI
jgi:uncharacterized membrane protein YdjX (TVP38/TMEM64 family)